ncbi:hypothetical protein RB195_004050 [Necator americanus]|uniref:Uncharacterized protein n=1 Tax=Necator americanus TaxID=51031 RepID=A0ABR1BG19_NECAM
MARNRPKPPKPLTPVVDELVPNLFGRNRSRLQLKNEKSPFGKETVPNVETPFDAVLMAPPKVHFMERSEEASDFISGKHKQNSKLRTPEKTQKSDSGEKRNDQQKSEVYNKSLINPPTGVLGNPASAKIHNSVPESRKTESSKKREKFKMKRKLRARKTNEGKTTAPAAKEEIKDKALASKKTERTESSSDVKVLSKTTKGGKERSCNKSESYPILETACEDRALLTEAVNRPPPKIDNFFEMANPFENEYDLLDVSDTIFDIANDFPDICLPSKLFARHIEALDAKKPKKGISRESIIEKSAVGPRPESKKDQPVK